MSYQKSTSGGDSLSLSRNGERTPLRTLHNDNLNDSAAPLNLKSKAELLKQTKENALICAQKNALASDIINENQLCKQDGTPVCGGMVSCGNIHSVASVEHDSDHAASYYADVTLKSYDCDGGEVEISSEVVGKADDSIPLPQLEIREYSQHGQILDSSTVFDSTGYCNTDEENTDHAYCRGENGTASDKSMTEVVHNRTDLLGNVTLKFLNCTGGEIEIRDSIDSGDGTILLPANQNGNHAESCNYGVDSCLFTDDFDADHLDHPYCNTASVESADVTNQPSIHKVLIEKEQINSIHKCKESTSLLTPVLETQRSIGWTKVNEAPLLLEAQSPKPLTTNTILKQTNNLTEEDTSRANVIKRIDVESPLPEMDASPSLNVEKTKNLSTKGNSHLDVSALALPQYSSNGSKHKTTSDPLTNVKEEDGTHDDSQAHFSTQPHQGSDSALCLSPIFSVSTETPQAETLPDVLKAIAECTPLHLKFLTPIVRRASLACIRAQKDLAADQFGGDFGQMDDKSVVTPDLDHDEFWRGHQESPMARPLFNSTELIHLSQPCTIIEPPKDVTLPQPEVNKPVVDIPVVSEGPLQQQLRQMAEFLTLASRKIGSIVSAPLPAKSEHRNACVGTSPQRLVNHNINTSGQFEQRTSLSTEDQCTLTDPLLWK